ncbi:cellulose biosynthesis protein BcsN [Allorhizobium sp. BGMRC 0089]|uniref:cellulose biosynthesis protein BcsN n=1 Tax=Allorhizobium sonneratiae TaxID=2934936 RepID=UPI0020341006|nr:cellulose biosynthesis protein BcsN [Allorhizobium sonneratiae]MCM2290945.1 cellulose biosynthesis protein BcsN [Allorhizobium sonneratiae]
MNKTMHNRQRCAYLVAGRVSGLKASLSCGFAILLAAGIGLACAPAMAETNAAKGPPPMAFIKGLKAPILANRHRVEPHAAFQTIVYPDSAGKGENTLTIEIGLSGGPRYSQAAASNDAPDEMKKMLPGVDMKIVPGLRENNYGVYGIATGTLGKNGGACVFAWQAMASTTTYQNYDPVGDPGFMNLPVRITLRYCDAKATPKELIALMDHLSLRTITSSRLDLLR